MTEISPIVPLKRNKIKENGEAYIMLSYMHCILHLTKLKILKSRRLRWTSMEKPRNVYRILLSTPKGKETFREAET